MFQQLKSGRAHSKEELKHELKKIQKWIQNEFKSMKSNWYSIKLKIYFLQIHSKLFLIQNFDNLLNESH